MNNAHKKEEEKLIPFKTYLLIEAQIAESTAADYVKRIVTICREENIDVDYLSEHIDAIVREYTEGAKQDLGRRSHNSYRSALLRFQKFVQRGGVINSTSKNPKYHFEINQVPGELFGAIKLYDRNGKLLDTNVTLDKHHYSAAEISRDLMEKCVKMMFDKVYGKDDSKVLEVLRTLDCSLTISGKVIIS